MSIANPADGAFITWLLATLFKKIEVPTEFHDQARAVDYLIKRDVSGLVNSLTDFQISSANVDYEIQTESEELNKVLAIWLKNINKSYNGRVPKGIKALAEEYFKERWKGASFPVLKLMDWKPIGNSGFQVPTTMYFVDGGSIYSKKSENLKSLLKYDYFLGSKANDKLDKGVIITKPFSRWYEEYPVPYLVGRGIYQNWKLLEAIKSKQGQLIEQIIPYLMLLQRGDASFIKEGKVVTDKDLKEVKKRIEELYKEIESSERPKVPLRATTFDEKITHLIPKLEDMFNVNITASVERNILAGLGFIDIVEAVTTSRRESVLNPKAFIEEVNKGVSDFTKILEHVLDAILEVNKKHKKYANSEYYITHSPVRPFLTDDFKQELRLAWKNGVLSDRTYAEMVAEVDFRTEVFRRQKEAKDGTEMIMYPHITQNMEEQESMLETLRNKELLGIEDSPEDENEDGSPKSPDKIEDKDKFDKSSLEGAPYKTVKNLPSGVKNSMSISLQRVFLRAFNRAYNTYKSDERAFRIAWSVIKKIARKNDKGNWVLKSSRLKITESMLERAILENREEN